MTVLRRVSAQVFLPVSCQNAQLLERCRTNPWSPLVVSRQATRLSAPTAHVTFR